MVTEFIDIFNLGDPVNMYINLGKFNGKNLIMPCVSKCASSTIVNVFHKLNGRTYKTHEAFYYNWNRFFNFHKYIRENRISIDEVENRWFVAVIRDPIKKLISAYHTLSYINQYRWNFSPEEYINMINQVYDKYAETNVFYIDRHLNNQFLFYEHDKVDTFVQIEDLDKFFASIGIDDIKRYNAFHTDLDAELFKKNDKLMKHLEKEYEIYNSILESDKLYKQEQATKCEGKSFANPGNCR